MKWPLRLTLLFLPIASCATEKDYIYIGEADLRNFGCLRSQLVLYKPDGIDSLVFATDGPRVGKTMYTTAAFHGLKRAQTEAENRWFTYHNLNGNGNIHIGLSSDERQDGQLARGRSMLQIQMDMAGGSFYSLYCQNGALLPADQQQHATLTHFPKDTIRHASGNYTGYYRVERAQPWPGWLKWTAVWIRPGQALAGLETAGGELYLCH